MNYIRHLNHVLESFIEDERIIPRHVRMYMALFFLWNKLKFPEIIHIVRSELMLLSKLGSMKFYHLTLRELHEWGYIDYRPSKSCYRCSGVKMHTCFNSDTSSDTSTDTSGETTTACSTATSTETSSAPSSATSSSTSSGTTSEAININSNKTIINHTNSKETIENKSEHARDAHPTHIQNEESSLDKKDEARPKGFQKPTLHELQDYFEDREAPTAEAQRFLNHFESNGWKVGGKSPMKDWKAAVRNWILNMQKYQRGKAEHEQNPLSTLNDKDYGEPL
ncbi:MULTISPECIES: hypothetical protein [unclassified Carboxylicivirga]|uniref:hypothetical protein n=1 Tax=Carboxylicivirga TaxID=1628153 RepID=UPI003D3335A9